MSFFEINDSGTVVVHGNLDAERLKQNWWRQLSSSQRDRITTSQRCEFDLSDVERADSAGLAWLINAIRDGRSAGVDVVLSHIPQKLLNLASISDVDTLLPIAEQQ